MFWDHTVASNVPCQISTGTDVRRENLNSHLQSTHEFHLKRKLDRRISALTSMSIKEIVKSTLCGVEWISRFSEDLKSAGGNPVPVWVRFSVPIKTRLFGHSGKPFFAEISVWSNSDLMVVAKFWVRQSDLLTANWVVRSYLTDTIRHDVTKKPPRRGGALLKCKMTPTHFIAEALVHGMHIVSSTSRR
jgi:hypothetical protein